MKTCPKCNKNYDDSWGVCLGCNKKLIEALNTDEKIEATEEHEILVDEVSKSDGKGKMKKIIKIWNSISINFLIKLILILGVIYLLTLLGKIFFPATHHRYISAP